MTARAAQQRQNLSRGFGDIGAGAEYRLDPGIAQKLVILLRDHAATNHDDIGGIGILQRLHQLRSERLVPSHLTADPDHMHIAGDRIPRRLGRGLKQRAYIDLKADVGKRRSNDLCPPVMPILPHLDHQHVWSAAFFSRKTRHLGLHRGKVGVIRIGRAIDTTLGMGFGLMAAKHLFHRGGYFTHRGAGAGGGYGGVEQIAAMCCAVGQVGQGALTGRFISRRTNMRQSRDLGQADRDVVNRPDINRLRPIGLVFIDADNHLDAAINHRLFAGGVFFDPQFRHARRHSAGHATQRLNLIDQHHGLVNQGGCQAFHIIRPRQRIDHAGHPGFFLQNQLGIASDAGGKGGGQGNRLVQRVGMQRLGATQNRAQRLVCGADDVVIGVLFLQ